MVKKIHSKEELLEMVGRNQLKYVLSHLAETHKSAEVQEVRILFSSRLNDIEQKEIRGLMTYDQKNVELQQLRSDLLKFIQVAFPDSPPSLEAAERKSNSTMLFALVLLVGAIVALLWAGDIFSSGDDNESPPGKDYKSKYDRTRPR